MALKVRRYTFTSTTSTDYTNCANKTQANGGANPPSGEDALSAFLATYPQWVNNMHNCWDFYQGDMCLQYNSGYSYDYFRLSEVDVTIQTVVYNGTALKSYIYNGTTVWTKSVATFSGLVGASPSSYASQTVLMEDNVVSPGTPTKSYYVHDGWSPSLPRTITVDTVFSAVWRKNPVNPDVSYLSRTTSSLTYRVTNNNPYSVTLYYEHTDNTPDAHSINISANSYADVTVASLSANTSYTVYFQFITDGNNSSVVSSTNTTQAGTPTNWVYVGTSGTYNGTVTKPSVYNACASTSAVDTWLTSNYAVGGYASGYKMRVAHSWYDDFFNITQCSYYYYEAQ